MFGLFGKKKPSNGWVKLGIGGVIPAKDGQKFDVRVRCGDEVYGLIYGRPCRGVTANGEVFEYRGLARARWNFGNRPYDVIAYRLHEPDADAAQRAARLALFNGIRRAAEKTGKVTVPDHRPEEVEASTVAPSPGGDAATLSPTGEGQGGSLHD